MEEGTTSSDSESLNEILSDFGLSPLGGTQIVRFAQYLELILKWNARFNLTAIRDRDAIIRSHFVDCIACAQALPQGIRSLLDFGSGAGFPGIPVAICRPDLNVTLAESQTKKAGFLNEVVRTLGLTVTVFAGRAESISTTFDCLTLRAVDRMSVAIKSAIPLVSPGGWLVVMTTEARLPEAMATGRESISWLNPVRNQHSMQRILLIGARY